jgi:hypothetical protein
MIQMDMLVVESKERKSCEGILRSLDRMYRQCLNDGDYAASGNPWHMHITKPPASHAIPSASIAEAKKRISNRLSRRWARSRINFAEDIEIDLETAAPSAKSMPRHQSKLPGQTDTDSFDRHERDELYYD